MLLKRNEIVLDGKVLCGTCAIKETCLFFDDLIEIGLKWRKLEGMKIRIHVKACNRYMPEFQLTIGQAIKMLENARR